jgi:hypothetical protein
MKTDDEIIESLIAGGLIGATLGALISKNNEEEVMTGAIIGAVILGTFKASERALATNIPMYVEENGNLYQVQKGVVKKFIRKIEKSSIKLPSHFKLK